MANKKISDFTEVTTVGDSDWLEIETAAGNSRKVKKSNLAAGAMILLQRVVATGTENSLSFTSIDQSFRNLLILGTHGNVTTSTTTAHQLYMRFNGDTGANYSSTNVGSYGGGTGFGFAGPTTALSLAFNPNTGAANTPMGGSRFEIPSYRATDRKKTVLAQHSGVQENVGICRINGGGLWNSISAISQIDILDQSGNLFTTGSEFELYGIM